MTKRMNNLLHSLACKRQKLKESEDLIHLFEQAPRPGTSKWEQATLQKCRKLEYDIENVKGELLRLLNCLESLEF